MPDSERALRSLSSDMEKEEQKLIEKAAEDSGEDLSKNHPLMKSLRAIHQVNE
ncbi:hypothetical protein [Butyrivibrio sp. LC3010]|nr:hypothetical protein [Butyrivibrio sp. LC3010]